MPLDEAFIFVIAQAVRLGHSGQTIRSNERTLSRFRRYAHASDAHTLDDLTHELVTAFVNAPGADRQPPAPATRHSRLNALRLAVRILIEFGYLADDPTQGIQLPPRTWLSTRPLTDTELDLCRLAAHNTLFETRLPSTLALAEATAWTSEAAAIAPADVDLDAATVRLPGCKSATARVARLTPWGVTRIRNRIAWLEGQDGFDPATTGLVYNGTASPESAQASTSDALLRVLAHAGLGGQPDVGIGSIRASTGLDAYRRRYRIQDAALVLGCRSLDTAARIIGLDWHAETAP